MYNTDNDTIVFNPTTREFVPYSIDPETTEIKIKSYNIFDNEDTCIVTTWNNIYYSNLRKKERRLGKRS